MAESISCDLILFLDCKLELLTNYATAPQIMQVSRVKDFQLFQGPVLDPFYELDEGCN